MVNLIKLQIEQNEQRDSYVLSYLKLDWLVIFYGISTHGGYLMPNPIYIYIYIYETYMIFK